MKPNPAWDREKCILELATLRDRDHFDPYVASVCWEVEQYLKALVLPKYVEIADHIRGQIASGDLGPGDQAPSEREIARGWRVTRDTANKALALLRSEGLIETEHGKGSSVRTRAT